MTAPSMTEGRTRVSSNDIDNMERPESWKATMLSGRPLITDEQFAKLMANAPASLEEMEKHDPVPVLKIFLPHIRWLLVWGYNDDPERFFCVARMGAHSPEAGDVWLPDIVNARLGRVRPERDLYITLDKPWSHYLRNPEAW